MSVQAGLYAAAGPRKGREHLTAIYLPRGGVTHLLDAADSPNDGYALALCGRQPRWGHAWHGTGSEREYDEARRRPLCSQCATNAPATGGA